MYLYSITFYFYIRTNIFFLQIILEQITAYKIPIKTDYIHYKVMKFINLLQFEFYVIL
jgi:hypothetical protein